MLSGTVFLQNIRKFQKIFLKGGLKDAARTPKDFENVIAWWNRLDANRQRKERYHELSRSGDNIPLISVHPGMPCVFRIP